MITSTMQDFPLTVTHLLRHGRRMYPASRIFTYHGPDAEIQEATFPEVADRADRLAAALGRLGVGAGEPVGTFMWNNQRHMEAYLAVPSMGAVLHTLNIRLFPDQLAYVINHGGDRVILVDACIAPLLAAVRERLETVEHVVVCGEGDTDGLGGVIDFEEMIAAEQSGFDYPEIDERSAAAMCYTSGTTGNPKGVVYSHRSTFLHCFNVMSANTLGFTERDRVLMIVPQFHANAWGMPYGAWAAGADMVMPQQFLQSAPIVDLIERTRPTVSGAVPTVLNDVLHNQPQADLGSFRYIACGGSAVPRALMEGFEKVFGVEIVQAWGMTETSPLGAISRPPKHAPESARMEWKTKTGRVLPGAEVRICDDAGGELTWDGVTQGEIEIRGPWVTAGYHLDPTTEKFHDGWLRTGDVGAITPDGFIQISDRAKDVIKSGGEWISSVDLENELMAHPAVVEAVVVGVPDDRWDERPLACVVLAEGASVTAEGLRDFLAERVARFWLPERWAFIDEVPKTSVGKFDKKRLRASHLAGDIEITRL